MVSSAVEGIAPDILFELGRAGVGTLAYVLPAAAVIEDGDRRERRVGDRNAGLAALVVVARIAHRKGTQERASVVEARVAGVDPDEGHLATLCDRRALKSAELRAAWDTPGRPLVDHHGVAVERLEACSHGGNTAGQKFIRLGVQRGQ